MTREELTARLTGPFHERFADRAAAEVLAADAVSMLYDLATGDCGPMAAAQRHKVRFRGAYVLERIFFEAPERFAPCEERFCRRDFAACTDPGARRSFAKMMTRLLALRLSDPASVRHIAAADRAAGRIAAVAAGCSVPAASGWAADPVAVERIAAAAADWAADPATKVAVRIWCVEVLRLCRSRVGWIADLWDDLLETLSRDATPAIVRRMKGWSSDLREKNEEGVVEN